MSEKDILEMASSAAVGASALVVALLGLRGLNTWKKHTKFEVARKLLQLGKQFANEIQRSRNPLGSSEEAAGRSRGDTETNEQAEALDQRYAHMKRLELPAMTLRDLQQASWEAEASLKTDLSAHIQRFIDIHNEITLAVEKRYLISEGLELTLEESKDIITTLYGPAPTDDHISQQLEEAQSELGKALKRYI